MNHRMILRLICYILRVEAVCLLPSLGISFFRGEIQAAWGTGITIALAGVLSLSTFLRTAAPQGQADFGPGGVFKRSPVLGGCVFGGGAALLSGRGHPQLH